MDYIQKIIMITCVQIILNISILMLVSFILQGCNATLSSTVYRHQLALYAISRVRAEIENKSPIDINFLPSLVAYNDSVNSLLEALPVIVLDAGQPVITITSPLPGAILTKDQGPSVIVNDDVGILVGHTTLLIDGVYYQEFLDSYMTTTFINTIVFNNGPHIITIKSINNVGHISTSSVNINFINCRS